jgi:NADH dehydrogenase
VTHRIVVLGAGYAGLTAARRLSRRTRGPGTTVTVVNRSPHFVERIRLHQLAAGHRLPMLPIDVPDLVVGTVTEIDPARSRVRVAGGWIDYQTLVYALGSETDRDSVPGVRDHAYTLANSTEAERLARCVTELPAGAELVVVGGGLTGIEAATEIAQGRPDLRVTLATAQGAGDWLSTRARTHLSRAFDRLRVTVRQQTTVAAVRPEGVLLSGGTLIRAAAVVWAAGFSVPPLARDAGLAVDERDRMVVDDHLRSVSDPAVYGIGDAAAAPTPWGAASRMSCQTGLPMGAYVAQDIVRRQRGRPTRPVRIRYVWQNISLGRTDAVTQFTRSDDSPVNAVLTGRVSALFKELISSSAAWTARW